MKELFKSKHTKVMCIEGLEMVVRPAASAILAIDDNGYVIMVEQDRGVFGKTLEVPAGKVDDGENPLEAAIREFREETGYKSNDMIPLSSYYPSCGYSTEEIHCFLTEEFKLNGKQRLDDNERIIVKKIHYDDLMDKIENGYIKDSKTIMCMLLFKLKHVGNP